MLEKCVLPPYSQNNKTEERARKATSEAYQLAFTLTPIPIAINVSIFCVRFGSCCSHHHAVVVVEVVEEYFEQHRSKGFQ